MVTNAAFLINSLTILAIGFPCFALQGLPALRLLFDLDQTEG
jgi:hypothetical protein